MSRYIKSFGVIDPQQDLLQTHEARVAAAQSQFGPADIVKLAGTAFFFYTLIRFMNKRDKR